MVDFIERQSGSEVSFVGTIGARLLYATRIVDAGFLLFDRARSELVAALASDRVLDRFNELAYGRSPSYDAADSRFRADLFSFEEQVITELFPKPPGRILIGGAGGGREVFALASRGYQVLAFEPSLPLAQSMRERLGGKPIEVYVGRYDSLPRLRSLEGAWTDLDALEPFDAAIVGWGSFSHLRTDRVRVKTLEAFARVTRGPILVSFIGIQKSNAHAGSRAARLRRRLPRRRERALGDTFSIFIGFIHKTNEAEVEHLVDAAGLDVVQKSLDENWPHVVLRRRDGETRS
jgi:hypothetical protein